MDKELRRCDCIKDLEMGRLSWITRVKPRCNHEYPWKREEDEAWYTQKKRPCEDGGRETGGVWPQPGQPGVPGIWTSQDAPPLEPAEEDWPC